MYSLEVKVKFRAGHRLSEPYKGKCNNPHGEGYTSIFILESKELDECGMIEDFGKVKNTIKKWIDKNLDHHFICIKGDNVGKMLKKQGFDVYEMDNNPTAENLSKLLYDVIKPKLPKLIKVGVVESFSDSVAWYRG